MRIRKIRSVIISVIFAVLILMAGLIGCGRAAGTGADLSAGSDFAEVTQDSGASVAEEFAEYTESDSGQKVYGQAEESTDESYSNDSSTLLTFSDADGESTVGEISGSKAVIDKDGVYTSKDDVALYIYTYGELPGNFITKKQAKKLGWTGGSLEPYAPGKCIGGDFFGNYEGLLPEKRGREYHECDIDTLGRKKRGSKRIIFSNDGLIYYTGDHYEHFELLYGEE